MSSVPLREESGEASSVLLVGYNGANNTGSEARLLEIVKEVRESIGPSTHITVPTLNERNLRRYLMEDRNLRIATVPSIYFFEMRRLVRSHDLIMLVEGSCYMDTWTSILLWAFLGATKYADTYCKPSLAYAVDAGRVSKGNERRVRKHASKTGLIITRTQAAADRLRKWGVTAPIEVTADNAFSFHLEDNPRDYLRRVWPEVEGGVAGISMIDFYLWPVVLRPCGRRSLCYRWPYYYSNSRKRRQSTDALAEGLARQADRLVERYGLSVALIAMEGLDEPLAKDVKARMRNSERGRVFSSNQYGAAEMTLILRNLDLLITSRYHASVLSLAAGVPQIAVGHDLRLWDLYGDLGVRDTRFLRHDSSDLWTRVEGLLDEIMEDPGGERSRLLEGNRKHLRRSGRNRELLRQFAIDHDLVMG